MPRFLKNILVGPWRNGIAKIALGALVSMSFSAVAHGQQSPNARTIFRDDYFLKLWRSEQQEVVIDNLNAAPSSLVEALEKARCVRPKQDGVYDPYNNLQRPVRIFKLKSGEDARFLILASCIDHEKAFVVPNPLLENIEGPVARLLLPTFTNSGSIGASGGAIRLDWDKGARILSAIYASDVRTSPDIPHICLRHTYNFGNAENLILPQGYITLLKLEASKGCDFKFAESITVLWKADNIYKRLYQPK